MRTQDRIDYYTKELKQKIENALKKDRKNIVVMCFYDTYRSQYGDLLKKLSNKHNVIAIVPQVMHDSLEKSVNEVIVAHWRFLDNNTTYYFYLDICGIDLILTTDCVGYEEGKIDREFLNKNTKKIYMPHSLLLPTSANNDFMDYIIVPTTISKNGYKKANNKAKLLECGYPKLDFAISNYKHESNNTISYVSTLKFVNSNDLKTSNMVAGFDSSILEWLLDNTSYNISYRPHPMNSKNNHIVYALIRKKYENNKRISIDMTDGNLFCNFSDFVITDYSTSAFTYSFSTLRPSFCIAPYNNIPVYNESFMKIGGLASNFKQLGEMIENIDFESYRQKIQEFRDEILFNPLKSSDYICEQIDKILEVK